MSAAVGLLESREIVAESSVRAVPRSIESGELHAATQTGLVNQALTMRCAARGPQDAGDSADAGTDGTTVSRGTRPGRHLTRRRADRLVKNVACLD